MYVCVCIYTYIYMYIYICINIYVCIQTGFGVFALEALKKDDYVCCYAGLLMGSDNIKDQARNPFVMTVYTYMHTYLHTYIHTHIPSP